jgi:hypothetical protein
MPRCKHETLVLLAPASKKRRCRHCHLTIGEEELDKGYCPECYEAYGVKRRDFEAIEADEKADSRYSCEKCGAIITT